jgi:hypothetical protein
MSDRVFVYAKAHPYGCAFLYIRSLNLKEVVREKQMKNRRGAEGTEKDEGVDLYSLSAFSATLRFNYFYVLSTIF